jgi:hypothetical protein
MSTKIKQEMMSNPFEDPSNQLPLPQNEYIDAFLEFDALHGRTVYTGKRLPTYSESDVSSTSAASVPRKLRKRRHTSSKSSTFTGAYPSFFKQQLNKWRWRQARREAAKDIKRMRPVEGPAKELSYVKMCGILCVIPAVVVVSTIKKCCSLEWVPGMSVHYSDSKIKAMPLKKRDTEEGGRRNVVSASNDRKSEKAQSKKRGVEGGERRNIASASNYRTEEKGPSRAYRVIH